MAHDDQVAIVRYDHDRVMEGLAFRYARVGGLGKSDDPPPEVVDRALEAEARAGRRLEEKRGDYFSGEHLAVRIGLEPGVASSMIFRISSCEKSVIEIRFFFPICRSL